MDRHRAFLRTVCRVCAEVIARNRKYSVASVKYILVAAYKDNCDITKDNADTESTFVCNRCCALLKRWNSAYEKHLIIKRKNPTSDEEFISSSKIPASIEDPWVHLIVRCPCADHAEPVGDVPGKADHAEPVGDVPGHADHERPGDVPGQADLPVMKEFFLLDQQLTILQMLMRLWLQHLLNLGSSEGNQLKVQVIN